MPEQIIPVGYSKVTFRWIGNGAPTGAECVFGVINGPNATPLVIANAIAGLYATHLDPITSAALTLAELRVKNGPNEDGPIAVITPNNQGAAGEECTPPNVAILVKKVTAEGGRRNRARMFYPGPQEVSVFSNGLLSQPYVATLQTAFSNFHASLANANYQMVVLHSLAGPPTPVTGLAVQIQAATQRNRLRR
jgi:hypothetical protein